ncbi:MAG: glycosyltransferase [Hyphomicrobium sp.]
MQRIADVDLLVLPVAGGTCAPLSLPDVLGVKTTVIPVAGRRDTAFELLSRLADAPLRLDAFRRYGRSSMAAQLSMPVLADVAAFAAGRRYDLVHVGRAYMAEAGLRVPGRPLLSVDIDENNALAWRSLAALRKRAGSPQAALFAEAEAEAHAREMRAYLPRYDAHFACSSAEAQSVGSWLAGRHAVVIPNTASVPNLQHRYDDGRTLVFVGTLGYEPNVEGLDWFARQVWPTVLAKARRAPRLLIAGSGGHKTIDRMSGRPGIQVIGAVVDVGSVYGRATIAIAPIRAGGGTRIKIVEAALARIPVVATSFAAAGLPLSDRRDLWLADDAPGIR